MADIFLLFIARCVSYQSLLSNWR